MIAPMRRVLLAVPLKGQLSSFFVRNLIETCRAIYPGVSLDFAFLEGAPVQQARNEIVADARERKFDELIMLDKDLDVGPEQVARILSHDVPFVAGLYCQKSLDTFWHVQSWAKDQKPDEAGLLRVKQCAVGFCKIKLGIFEQLQADNLDRLGMLTTTGGDTKPIWEFFAMELSGPNTANGRIAAIKDLLSDEILANAPVSFRNAIVSAAVGRHPTPSLHLAEDYGFCTMLRNSEIPIVVDTKLVIQHEGSVMLPIPTEHLEKMVAETWRG